MREKIKKFSKSRRILFVYTEGFERFNESRFNSRKVKRRAISSENRKFFVFVMKSALGVVKKMLTNGRFVKLLWAYVGLARANLQVLNLYLQVLATMSQTLLGNPKGPVELGNPNTCVETKLCLNFILFWLKK